MKAQRHRDSMTTGATPRGRRLLRATAWAGVAGPVVFTVSFLAQEQFRRGEYSPMAEPISALEAGPNGWIQQVTFVVFGVLTMAQAAGLHRAIAPSPAGFAGPAFLFLTGVGAIIAGVFPLRADAAGATYDPGGHMAGGMLFFLGSPIAFLLLSVRLRRDPSWRSLSPYAVAAGVALLGVGPDDERLGDPGAGSPARLGRAGSAPDRAGADLPPACGPWGTPAQADGPIATSRLTPSAAWTPQSRGGRTGRECWRPNAEVGHVMSAGDYRPRASRSLA